MKKLVVFPSDPMEAYIKLGQTYEYFDNYFNPGSYFDEVYSLSPWGEKEKEKIGNVIYIKTSPINFSEIISKIQPDVVRAYGGYHCSDWATMNKISGIPVVVSVHDTNPALIFDSIKYADYIICMAECVKRAVLEKVSFDSRKIWVMPNRIDTKLFSRTENKEAFKQLNDRFGTGRHILHVGRKSKQKNIDTLIKALRYLDNDVSVIFVGRGDCREYIDLAKEVGVWDRCHFVEAVKNIELPVWYSWCDCFCTPSRWEGFGFVFIEAASCEAPIITSNIAPMNEYLINGKNAVLVDDYENPKRIAGAIIKVFEGGENISNIKSAARSVGLQFSKEAVDKQEINIYEEIINKGSNSEHMQLWSRIRLRRKYMKIYGK